MLTWKQADELVTQLKAINVSLSRLVEAVEAGKRYPPPAGDGADLMEAFAEAVRKHHGPTHRPDPEAAGEAP